MENGRIPLTTNVWTIGAVLGCVVLAYPQAQQPAAPNPFAARVDPYVEKQRVVVMTDIANEPDDQMSMVRLLVYSNQFDIEGLVATTSTWMKNKVRPDVIHTLIDAYSLVRPKLLEHQPGFPSAESLKAVVVSGQPAYGMAAVGTGQHERGRRADSPVGGEARPASALDPRVGRSEHSGPVAPAREGDEDAGRARRDRLEAARLLDLGSGRCRPVDPAGVSGAALHRAAVDARR